MKQNYMGQSYKVSAGSCPCEACKREMARRRYAARAVDGMWELERRIQRGKQEEEVE